MPYKIREDVIPHYTQRAICEDKVDVYLQEYRNYLLGEYHREGFKEICSGLNRMKRRRYWCCEGVNLSVKKGDIVYMEFGQAFLNEAGFQHFGLVMGLWNRKAFIIPMTSNKNSFKSAVNVSENGRNHLYYIGYVDGLSDHSTLFLNDAKMLNTSRVISVNGSVCPNSDMFKEIQWHLVQGLF